MANTLMGAVQWTEPAVAGTALRRLQFMELGNGRYTFATSGRRVAGSVVVSGDTYTPTVGVSTGRGIIAQAGDVVTLY